MSWDHWPIGWPNSQGHEVNENSLKLYPNAFSTLGMDFFALPDTDEERGFTIPLSALRVPTWNRPDLLLESGWKRVRLESPTIPTMARICPLPSLSRRLQQDDSDIPRGSERMVWRFQPHACRQQASSSISARN